MLLSGGGFAGGVQEPPQIRQKHEADQGRGLLGIGKNGGAGVWGPVPMPANAGVSDADIKTVVEWVLAGAPAK